LCNSLDLQVFRRRLMGRGPTTFGSRVIYERYGRARDESD
jgi:hypothetical protein